MTQALKMSRKALTVGIVLTTLAWSMMATVLVAPLKASAAGCTSGSLIKGSLAAVYYCGSDGKRYVFTNDKAYFTWYGDFSGVMKLSDADLASIQIGGNVTYRPGVKMLKIQSDPKVYAIAHGGVLRPIASEAVAACLYGSTWNKQIDDVSDAFFTNYTVGAAINVCGDFDKSAEMSSSQSINSDKNLGGSTSTGSVQASAASDMPSSKTLPKGSMGVNVLKFNLKNNSSSDATVSNLTVHRSGPGATADWSSVYLYEGAARLTTGRSINSSTNDVNFTGLNLVLSAGQSRTLWVAADVSTTAAPANVHAFAVTAATAGSDVVGGLPILGNNMTISGATVGSLTISKTGSLTDPKVGQTNVLIAQFQIAAGSSEDIWLNRLTLTQAGNLSGSNLTNLKLKQASNTIATASSLDSKLHATFNLAAPMMLEKGATKTFEVWADIGGAARSADTIKLYVEEDADVYAVGATFGQGVTVTRTTYDGDSCTSSSGDCSFSTVQGGQITLAFNGPSTQNLPSNGKDRELFNFTLASQANVEVKRITLVIACTTGTADVGGCKSNTAATPNYTDIKVTNTATGQVWWGPQDLLAGAGDSDSSQTLIFNDVQTLAAGSSQTFKVTADIKSTVPSTDTVKVTFQAFGSSDVRSLDNNTFVATADMVPTGNIAGNPQTIVAPTLTISLASSPVTQSFVKGSTSVPFVGVNLKAGDGADIKVTSITMTGFIDAVEATLPGTPTMVQGFDDNGTSDVAVSDDILSCKLFDGSTQIGDTKSPTSSSTEGSGGLLQFTSLNLTVPMSTTKSLTLKCDTSNSAFRNSDAEVIGFSVQAATDVSAQDPDGNSVVAPALSGAANATAANVRVGISDTGTMSYLLAPDDSESEASLVLAGQSSAVLAKIRLTAQNEELKQTKMRVQLVNSASYTNIISMSLYDGATLVAGPVSIDSTGAADFTGMNFVVAKDASKTLTVKAALATIASGAVSGSDLSVMVDLSTPTAGTFEYRGTQSSTVVTTIASTDVTGRSKLLRKTKPTVSLASLPTTTLVNGGGTVATRFTVTADAAEQVSLKKVSFKVAVPASTETVTAPAVREVGQGSDISASGTVQIDGTSACGFVATVTSNCVTVSFTNEQIIGAGTSKTYELRLTSAGFGTGESMSTNLLGDSADVNGQLSGTLGSSLGVTGAPVDNFIWSDNSAIPHNDTIATGSNDWKNGWLVKVLPADAQTLSF